MTGSRLEDRSIIECRSRLEKILGPSTEPTEVLLRVEEHRQYWRPKDVSVILLAESHVYTTAEEMGRVIALPAFAPRDLPRGFARFVYCLGYGENGLLNSPIVNPPNSGTPQFWKIFYSCANPVRAHADFSSLQAAVPAPTRIANKLALLQRLRELGVWLVDTSIAALYTPQRPKTSPALIRECLKISWDHHVRRVVEAAKPRHIICIGRGVARALGTRLTGLGVPVDIVPQPQARLSGAEHLRSFETHFGVVEAANYRAARG